MEKQIANEPAQVLDLGNVYDLCGDEAPFVLELKGKKPFWTFGMLDMTWRSAYHNVEVVSVRMWNYRTSDTQIPSDYGAVWRCWDRMPDKEQMESTPWER